MPDTDRRAVVRVSTGARHRHRDNMQARHRQTRHRKSTDARGRHRHKIQDTSMGGPASAARGHRKMHKTARTARASQNMHETQPFLSKRVQRRTTLATAPRCRVNISVLGLQGQQTARTAINGHSGHCLMQKQLMDNRLQGLQRSLTELLASLTAMPLRIRCWCRC